MYMPIPLRPSQGIIRPRPDRPFPRNRPSSLSMFCHPSPKCWSCCCRAGGLYASFPGAVDRCAVHLSCYCLLFLSMLLVHPTRFACLCHRLPPLGVRLDGLFVLTLLLGASFVAVVLVSGGRELALLRIAAKASLELRLMVALTMSRVLRAGDGWLGLLDCHRTLASELLAAGMAAGAAVQCTLATGNHLGTRAGS